MTRLAVGELAYARVQVPDLERGGAFLTQFGLVALETDTPSTRFFRATDASPWCYELIEGPQKFLGFGFELPDRAALEAASREHGVAIEPLPAPGGGERVRLTEPNGHDVDLVAGRAAAAPLDVRRQLMNTGAQPLLRKGELFRSERGQVIPVKRLAHVVLGSPQVGETIRWFRDVLGLLVSDEVVAGPESELTGAFLRLDAGEEFVDHHTIFVVRSPVAGLHHLSFEAQDVDALLAEHTRLKSLQSYDHLWGIGRHMLGSQIFDYWRDPFGYIHEHWADTDRLNAASESNRWDVHQGMVTQWGEPTPAAVREGTRP